MASLANLVGAYIVVILLPIILSPLQQIVAANGQQMVAPIGRIRHGLNFAQQAQRQLANNYQDESPVANLMAYCEQFEVSEFLRQICRSEAVAKLHLGPQLDTDKQLAPINLNWAPIDELGGQRETRSVVRAKQATNELLGMPTGGANQSPEALSRLWMTSIQGPLVGARAVPASAGLQMMATDNGDAQGQLQASMDNVVGGQHSVASNNLRGGQLLEKWTTNNLIADDVSLSGRWQPMRGKRNHRDGRANQQQD